MSPNGCSKSPLSGGITHGVEPLHPLLEDGALNLSTRTLFAQTSPPAANNSIIQPQSFFVRSQAALTNPSLHPPNPLSHLTSTRPPPALLPATSLLCRPPLQLSHDLTLTPLAQYNSLAQEIGKQAGLPHPALSHAQALSLMSSIHLAHSQHVQSLASSSDVKDEHIESDIEVTDSEDTEDNERSNASKHAREFDYEVQDLSTKKRKIDFERRNPHELKLTTSIEEKTITSLPNDFLEIICRNNSQAECK